MHTHARTHTRTHTDTLLSVKMKCLQSKHFTGRIGDKLSDFLLNKTSAVCVCVCVCVCVWVREREREWEYVSSHLLFIKHSWSLEETTNLNQFLSLSFFLPWRPSYSLLNTNTDSLCLIVALRQISCLISRTSGLNISHSRSQLKMQGGMFPRCNSSSSSFSQFRCVLTQTEQFLLTSHILLCPQTL